MDNQLLKKLPLGINGHKLVNIPNNKIVFETSSLSKLRS